MSTLGITVPFKVASLRSIATLLVERLTEASNHVSVSHEELPRYLYRVHYPGSQTIRTCEGLEAVDTTITYSDSDRERIAFEQAVEDYFTWGY